MDGEAGWWTTSGNIGLPPLARAMGVGRQQQQEIVDEIPGGDGGHSQEDEGSLADAESTSDTLAYEGGIGQKYVKSRRKYQNGWINMSGIVKSKRNIVSCMLG